MERRAVAFLRAYRLGAIAKLGHLIAGAAGKERAANRGLQPWL